MSSPHLREIQKIKCPFGQYIQDNIKEYSIVTGATPNAAVVLLRALHKGQGVIVSTFPKKRNRNVINIIENC
ncbi:MAG: hypothetical protein HWQ38_27900 [Nostoc sp. NMS7]|uniref:hypothetical protein n=1 Tax=Nostoc sp. NMS7 TaxID=2815391 RepID=UPI0025D122AB|nr:hypothetical protein [Nostoc sp. NMS7]MBN3950088.1 hypothetical protein [Nostoc sp. NMS7]